MSALQVWPDEDSSAYAETVGFINRQNRRVTNPTLMVRVRGRIYQSLNWSLSGILLGGYDGVLSVGDTFEIEGIGLAGRKNWPVLIRCRAVRTGGESGLELAAQFLTINSPAYDILEGILLRRPGYRAAA